MDNLAPILFFVYNRPEHTRQAAESLRKNALAANSELYIYSDAARSEKDKPDVDKVREYIHSIEGFAKINIIERDKNFGLANNIIEGVSKLVNQYGRIIVLEDDLVVSPYFLQFMNEALEIYKDEEKVGHVHACEFFMNDSLPDTFLIKFVGSWGWGTWDRAWKYFNQDGVALLKELEERKLTRAFDFNNAYGFTRMLRRQIKGLNNSWAIRWNASLFLRDCYSLNVGKTLVENTGFDGSGTNCGAGGLITSNLYKQKLVVEKIEPVTENIYARKVVEEYYRKNYSFKAKAIRRIKRTMKGDFGA
ncbi:MAG: glycosyltransferase [Bacteroidales bacterium]|nr:glycosyltransferase [Bacteroidales bacterium]